MKYYIIFLILNQIYFVLSPIPNWDISAQSINLLSSTSSYDYLLYSSSSYGINVTLTKTITKTNDVVTSKNYLTVDGTTIPVDFEGIDSQYTNKLGKEKVICPKGKFHPYDFKNRSFITPPGFQDKGGWDLRCYDHFSGYFLIFYLLNDGKNFFFSYNNGNLISEKGGAIYSYFYDYKLENKDDSKDHNYEYKFPILQFDNNNLMLIGAVLILNYVDSKVEKNTFATKWLGFAKGSMRGSFDSNHNFYFIKFNNVSDFESGYSTSYVDFSSKDSYIRAINNMPFNTNLTSPFTFSDNVEIKDINFIYGTKYAYYKIYNSDKNKTYYGLLDVVNNKVLYNFDEDIKTFIPVSNSEMLAITSTSAYKICIIKSGSSCIESCSSSNLVLGTCGNICQSGNDCSSGKIKFMPENICIDQNSCDENYYTLSNSNECGLCSYFYPNGNKYKLINTTGCLGSIPNNAEYYNENLFLLKCKTNYGLNTNNECVPDYCYERCATCSEIGTSETDQKCSTCVAGYTLENGNCIVPPTTIIIPPTTVLPPTTVTIPPTTVTIPPTTVTIPPTTVTIPPTTVTIPPTTVTIPPTTVTPPPTTVTIPPTTVITPPTTEIIPPTTILPPPTTIITETPTEEKILETCTNKRCQTCSEGSDKDGLCLSCDENQYKKVNYTNKYSKYFNCFEEKELEYKYYKDTRTNQYKPCFQLCKKCLGPGNATHHNCLECMDNYMFRPEPNPHNNCVVYSEFYYRSAYGEYKTLDNTFCPDEAKYKIKDANNRTSCIYDCKVDKIYKYLYSGFCVKRCPENTNDANYVCKEDPEQIYISSDTISPKINITLDNIEVLAEAYAYEFYYTDNHISSLEGQDANILIYKNPNLIRQTNLKAPNIDFGDCYELVKKAYNITGNLIISIIDNKVKYNP